MSTSSRSVVLPPQNCSTKTDSVLKPVSSGSLQHRTPTKICPSTSGKRPPTSGLSPYAKKTAGSVENNQSQSDMDILLDPAIEELLKEIDNRPLKTRTTVTNNENEQKKAEIPNESEPNFLNDSLQDLLLNVDLPEMPKKKDLLPSELKSRDFTVRSWENNEFETRVLCLEDVTVILRGFWTDTPLSHGLPIRDHSQITFFGGGSISITEMRVFGPWIEGQTIFTISDGENFMVINPDVLVQCTTVASGVYCRRKTVLSDRFRGLDPPNVAMLVGILVHELFQTALKLGTDPNMSWFEKQLESIFDSRSISDQIYGMDLDPENVKNMIRPYFDQIIQWIGVYVVKQSDLLQADGLKLEKVRDIEENIWCPKLGLRGKVDVSLEVGTTEKRRLVPLELKTGKSSKGADHQGQVLLYTLMLSSLSDCSETVKEGLLLYLKDGVQHRVETAHNAISGVIQLRNDLAFYLGQKKFEILPPPINDSRFCPKCPQLLNCAAWQRTLELDKDFTGNSTMTELVPKVLAHLTQEDLSYFSKWIRWIFMEWEAAKKQKSNLTDIWRKTAEDREGKSEALSEIKLESVLEHNGGFHLVFRKFSHKKLPFGVFHIGDTVVGSSQSKQHVAVFMGSVRQISETELTVLVDKEIREELRRDKFRLDKYESFATFQINLGNISRLMDNTPQSEKLRRMVIGGQSPTFQRTMTAADADLLKPVVCCGLNAPQRQALIRVLLSNDYVLIKGLPGSGKTSTIVMIVKALVTLKKTVLITAYTHSAVDNILLKLSSDGYVSDCDILRLGSMSQVNAECRKYCPDSKLKEIGDTSLDAVRQLYDKTPVVACTCLQAANHVMFARGRKFDYVIVDEATLALQSACLGPLFCGEKFILVGDPVQLSPLVISNEAKSEGMGRCLFRDLESSAGRALVTLNLQYRMNKEIARFSSSLLYNDQLECASENVARATVDQLEQNDENLAESYWMKKCLSSQLEDSLLFLNTKRLAEKDQSFISKNFGPGLLGNEGEVKLAADLCSVFLRAGLGAENLGVICVYGYQKKLMKEALKNRDIEVNTVDQYQGKDKSVIILSFVWTPTTKDNHKGSELLKEKKRMNVALTRAKHKLVLIGHLPGLREYEFWGKFAAMLKEGQIVNL